MDKKIEFICDTNIYQTIFNSADIGISVVNKDGIFVFVNNAYCEFYGLSEEEIIGNNLSLVVPPERNEKSLKSLQELLKSGKPVMGETRIETKDGREVYLKVDKKRIRSSSGEYYRLTTLTDITPRKKHEIVQSILLDISHQASFAQHPYEIYDIIKDALDEIMPTDYFSIGIIDESTGQLKYLDDKSASKKISRKRNTEYESLADFVFNTGLPLLASEEKLEKLNIIGKVSVKGTLPKVWLGVPLHIKEKIIGIMAVYSFSDESDYTEHDKEIFEFMSDQVAHVIERRSAERELIKQMEKAEEASRLKSEFLTQISHEIRTPINSILSFSQLLHSELAEFTSDELKESFLMIDRGGRRLTRTIDMILNMSQIEHYEKYMEFKTFDLEKDVLSPIVIQYQSLAKSKGICLDLINNVETPKVCCDYNTTNQIFLQLIDNAIKFTNCGSVVCELSKNDNVGLQVKIKDTGIGISEEYLPKLFEEFSQEEAGYTRPYDGNGLGLALVKKFADLNKASVKVNSVKGEGSVFSVDFKIK